MDTSPFNINISDPGLWILVQGMRRLLRILEQEQEEEEVGAHYRVSNSRSSLQGVP